MEVWMVCPSCKKSRINATHVYKPGKTTNYASKYGDLNGIRRRRICADCGIKFYTIELTELDFEYGQHRKRVRQNEAKDK